MRGAGAIDQLLGWRWRLRVRPACSIHFCGSGRCASSRLVTLMYRVRSVVPSGGRDARPSMSECVAEGTGGFRPAFPLIAFRIACPPHWISTSVTFLSPNIQRLNWLPVATIAGSEPRTSIWLRPYVVID